MHITMCKKTAHKCATNLKSEISTQAVGCGAYMVGVCVKESVCVCRGSLISRQKPERCSVTNHTLTLGEGKGGLGV